MGFLRPFVRRRRASPRLRSLPRARVVAAGLEPGSGAAGAATRRGTTNFNLPEFTYSVGTSSPLSSNPRPPTRSGLTRSLPSPAPERS